MYTLALFAYIVVAAVIFVSICRHEARKRCYSLENNFGDPLDGMRSDVLLVLMCSILWPFAYPLDAYLEYRDRANRLERI